MTYVYAALWFVIGLLLIFRFGRENKIFYAAGGFFVILGGWWLVGAITAIDVFGGTWGILLRIVTAIALVLMVLAYIRSRKQDRAKDKEAQMPAESKKDEE